jgi:hypothetical protein
MVFDEAFGRPLASVRFEDVIRAKGCATTTGRLGAATVTRGARHTNTVTALVGVCNRVRPALMCPSMGRRKPVLDFDCGTEDES